MLKEQKNNNLQFLKMDGIGNDFVIFDFRNNNCQRLSSVQIKKICDRRNIGCDQLVIIKNSDIANCAIDIYNADGSKVLACGNATRCVAYLILEETKLEKVTIEISGRVLTATKEGNQIAVEMGLINFANNHFYFDDLKFLMADIGNPHAVCFVEDIPSDEEFFRIAPLVEKHQFFINKTNVEFAKIISDQIIEVRVFERGVGETLACGSGACAVASLAIKNKLVKSNKVLIRFRGGDLIIKYSDDQSVIMIGDCRKIFYGEIINV